MKSGWGDIGWIITLLVLWLGWACKNLSNIHDACVSKPLVWFLIFVLLLGGVHIIYAGVVLTSGVNGKESKKFLSDVDGVNITVAWMQDASESESQ